MTPTTSVSEYIKSIKQWIDDNQNIIYTMIFAISIFFALGSLVYRWNVRQTLNEKKDQLYKTSSYILNSLQSDETVKDSFPLRKQLSDMLGYESQIEENIKNTQLQRTRLSVPFENFLHMFYTPTINIWRDPFSWTIDTTLIGKKYIEKNPYGDIALIQQWTSFFKDVGVVDTYNTISDIRVWQIESSEQPGFFSIPITVQFETPDKRSFLLLVNKLSMTAYIQNLSLINEFMYYLRETLKEEKADLLVEKWALLNSWSLDSTWWDESSTDKIIWHLLYNWIVQWWDNAIVTQDIIIKAIQKTAWCTNESQEECMYLFREKMRALPYLAYGLWRNGVDIVEGFKFFFKNMPPILSIESFSFEPRTSKKKWINDSWYKGTVSIRIYWKDLLPDEISSISQQLWSLCYLNKDPLSIVNAKARVEKTIGEIGKWSLNTKRSLALNQILLFLTKLETEYDSLANYKKVIRLFEIYRTLKENTLCDVISQESVNVVDKPLWSWTKEEIIDFNDMSVDTLKWAINQKPETTWTWTFDGNRTIGDGKSKRDQQIANELDWIQ